MARTERLDGADELGVDGRGDGIKLSGRCDPWHHHEDLGAGGAMVAQCLERRRQRRVAGSSDDEHAGRLRGRLMELRGHRIGRAVERHTGLRHVGPPRRREREVKPRIDDPPASRLDAAAQHIGGLPVPCGTGVRALLGEGDDPRRHGLDRLDRPGRFDGLGGLH